MNATSPRATRWSTSVLAACAALAALGCAPELELFEANDPRCGEGYCELVGRTCGSIVDPCGARWECGACAEGSCSTTGRCESGRCPLEVGEVLELARYEGFRTRPVAFASTESHLYFWTAFPTLSTPGNSSVYRADKCGDELVELQERVGQDDMFAGYTLDVDETHVYFANQRPIQPVYRAPLLGGEREPLTEPLPRVCGLVVDAPRDRLVYLRCDPDAPGVYVVPRVGGASVRLFEGSPTRRVVREDDRLVWIEREPPGLGVADLGRDEVRARLPEPAVPRDVILHRGDLYWLRPVGEVTELVTLTVDGAFVLARFGPDVRSLAAREDELFVVDAESPWVVERATGATRRLAGRGGELVYADADGLYVSGTEVTGELSRHVVRRYGR